MSEPYVDPKKQPCRMGGFHRIKYDKWNGDVVCIKCGDCFDWDAPPYGSSSTIGKSR
jgi:hypothetical protein